MRRVFIFSIVFVALASVALGDGVQLNEAQKGYFLCRTLKLSEYGIAYTRNNNKISILKKLGGTAALIQATGDFCYTLMMASNEYTKKEKMEIENSWGRHLFDPIMQKVLQQGFPELY